VKVLHVGEYVKGGVATYLHTLFSGETPDDIDDYLVLSHPMSEKRWELPSSKVYYYPYARTLLNIPRAMVRIWRVICQVEPDILMVHSTWAGVFVRFPYLFLPKGKKKIIYNAHGWAFLRETSLRNKKLYALVEKLLSYVTDRIINVSDYEQNAAIAFGIPSKKMLRIYNGADVFGVVPAVEIPGFDPDKINLLFVGRLDRQKGLDWLLEQFHYNVSRQDMHLYVIGASVVQDQKISVSDDRVTFLGWVDYQQIDGYYSICDALIMPSRWEAFGLTAVEAMRNGTPVIASNRGALPELVHKNQSGWLFELDDGGKSLQEILDSLDKSSLINMGKNARTFYEAEFTANKMRKALFSTYYEVDKK